MAGEITMSAKELDRFEVVRRIVDGQLSQAKAAGLLGLTTRQVRRLCRALERSGPGGLASRRRGRPSNRRLPPELQARVTALVREQYPDFGPKLAREKLLERHHLVIGRETLRKWMAAAGIWLPRRERIRRAHQPRHRRACRGELVQIDGCDHEWFEDRAPRCALLVYVDDATGDLMELRFVEAESAFDYFAATRAYLDRHGRPAAFYSDKHSIFRVARGDSAGRSNGVTQFGRALAELNIDIICANTPQAKGRVKRMNKTLQDRLVKELRLRDISSMADGNAYLPTFMADYNRRFGRAPREAHDAHRSLRGDEDLDHIFAWQEDRRMSRDLVVHFKRRAYLVTPTPETLPFGGKTVRVHEWEDGRVELHCEGRVLPYSIFDKNPIVTRAPLSRTSGSAPCWPPSRSSRSSATMPASLPGNCPCGRRSACAKPVKGLMYRPSRAAPSPGTGHLYLGGKRTSLLGFDRKRGLNRLAAIWYESPQVEGFSLSALFSPGQNLNNDNLIQALGEPGCTGGYSATALQGYLCNDGAFGDAWSAALTFKRGPVYAAAAWEWHKAVNRTVDEAFYGGASPDGSIGIANEYAWKLAALVELPTHTKLGGIYEQLHRTNPYVNQDYNERDRDGFWLLLVQQLDSHDDLDLGWGHAGKTPGDVGTRRADGTVDAGPVPNEANMCTALIRHAFLDGQPSIYLVYARQVNENGAHYDLGAGNHGLQYDCNDGNPVGATPTNPGGGGRCWAGATLQAVSIGMTYNF